MSSKDLLQFYFPDLPDWQVEQLLKYEQLIREWNGKINLISRKDEDRIMDNHILHALAIHKVIQFAPGTAIMDVGTGGGFPGIPLAIVNPEANFLLVDSIGKKIMAVSEMAAELGLENLEAVNQRAEKVKHDFDFVTARAVTQMPKFVAWVRGKITKENNNSLDNGLLLLKGGNLTEELKGINYPIETYHLSNIYQEPFYETKKLLHVTGL